MLLGAADVVANTLIPVNIIDDAAPCTIHGFLAECQR